MQLVTQGPENFATNVPQTLPQFYFQLLQSADIPSINAK